MASRYPRHDSQDFKPFSAFRERKVVEGERKKQPGTRLQCKRVFSQNFSDLQVSEWGICDVQTVLYASLFNATCM